MKVGDVVRINQDPLPVANTWCVEVQGKIGVIVELLHATSTLPLANIMVLGNVDQFYLDQLEVINASR